MNKGTDLQPGMAPTLADNDDWGPDDNEPIIPRNPVPGQRRPVDTLEGAR